MSSRRTTRRTSRRAALERPVQYLDGATAFSEDDEIHDPIWLIEQLKSFPQFLEPLRTHVAGLLHDDGRKREPGDWFLLYLGYVFSGHTRVQRFLNTHRSSELWRECGFGDWRPSNETVALRFGELEETGIAEAFARAGDLCIQHGRAHEPRIGQDTACDATSFQADARLRHCCPTDTPELRERCRSRPRYAPQILPATTGKAVEDNRHLDARKPIDDEGEVDNKLTELPEDDPRRAHLPVGPRYYLQRGHIYRCIDPTAGGRKYDDKEFWLGGLLMAMVDNHTGAPTAIKAIPADMAEHRAYPELLERHRNATGAYPDRVAGDRGYSVRATFLHNTERGIASVFPWRQAPKETTRRALDRDEVDRHGVVRCRDCGGPCDSQAAGLGFLLRNEVDASGEPKPRPVIRSRCILQLTANCDRVQEISCAVEPRLLLPLSRLTEEYHALKKVGKSLERTWSHLRARYALAGKNPETRTRRRASIPCQETRAQAARFIEWFRVLLRNGWLGSHRLRNRGEIITATGRRALANLRAARERHLLDAPYGRYAFVAGYAPDPDPPPEPPAPRRKRR